MPRQGLLFALICLGCGGGSVDTQGTPDGPSAGPEAAVDAFDALAVDASEDTGVPPTLSGAGLYADIGSKTLAADVVEYAPTYVLWADGADKRRWIKLPPGTRIDTSNMDHWMFPPGTKFFKEFSLNGGLLETRLIWVGVTMVAYVWAPDGSDATLAPDGAQDINGTDHDAPAAARCPDCHAGEPGGILGFSAMQLSRSGPGVTLTQLAADGLLSSPPPAGTTYPAPGTGMTQQALGYLHANCGSCHSPDGLAYQVGVHVVLRTFVTETDPTRTMLWATTMRHPLETYMNPNFQYIIVPGDAAHSVVPFRMAQRGNRDQMPPIASEHPDTQAVTLITNWINSLPP